jgi:hypothetical protein
VTKKEFSYLTTGLKASYPRFSFLQTDEEMEYWYLMTCDMDYAIASNAIAEHVTTNNFPPSIADIRRLYAERCNGRILTYSEAWGVVQRAISEYGWYAPRSAFALMDDLTRSVVDDLGWSRLCKSENPTADRANFREAYEAKARKLRNDAQMPRAVLLEKKRIQERFGILPKPEDADVKELQHVTDEENIEPTDEQRQMVADKLAAARQRVNARRNIEYVDFTK